MGLRVSGRTIRRWETGEAVPRADELAEVCRVLELTPQEMFGGS